MQGGGAAWQVQEPCCLGPGTGSSGGLKAICEEEVGGDSTIGDVGPGHHHSAVERGPRPRVAAREGSAWPAPAPRAPAPRAGTYASSASCLPSFHPADSLAVPAATQSGDPRAGYKSSQAAGGDRSRRLD